MGLRNYETNEISKMEHRNISVAVTFSLSLGVDVAQLVESQTSTPLRQVRFPGAARDFSPMDNFQCRLSHGARTPPCAIACINICAHVKDPVVYVRVRWIMGALKHPAYAVGWAARLCRSCLSLGKATRISHGRNPNEKIQFFKKMLAD